MQYRIVRKHVLQPSAMHNALSSLERQVEEMSKEGWKPQGGLFSYNDYIMQILISDNDALMPGEDMNHPYWGRKQEQK